MDFALTEEQELLRNEARDFLEQEWSSPAMREMLDDPRPPTEMIWAKIAQLGWPGLVIPEEYQGTGVGSFRTGRPDGRDGATPRTGDVLLDRRTYAGRARTPRKR